MHTWFLCKIRYEKIVENGMKKKVTEPYLVDALSFTEAEARIIEEMTPFISGEFTVSDISRAHYSEIFTSEEESAVSGSPGDSHSLHLTRKLQKRKGPIQTYLSKRQTFTTQ